MVQKLIPQLPTLENLLNIFISVSNPAAVAHNQDDTTPQYMENASGRATVNQAVLLNELNLSEK